jgi:Leucine-rich repeat (LRR) protein
MSDFFTKIPDGIKESLDRHMDRVVFFDVNNEEIAAQFAVYEGHWEKLAAIKEVSLQGTVLTIIPEAVKHLPSLKTLKIRRCSIWKFPLWIGDIPGLHLELYDLTNESLLSLLGCFDAPWYEKAKITGLLLQGAELTEIPACIGKLDLSYLNFHATGITEIPEWVRNFTRLESFNLYGSAITILPEWLCDFPMLKHLGIDRRGDQAIKALPKNLGKLHSLEELHIWYCDIDRIPESCWDITTLKTLEFSGLKITELPHSITRCTNLETIEIYQCNIKKIPDDIGSLTSLIKLKIDHYGMSTIPASIVNLSSLEILELNFQQNGKMTELPDFIGNLTSLVRLKICGGEFLTLPSTIGNLKLLKQLELTHINHFYSGNDKNDTFTLPEAIGNLTSLIELRLTNTDIKELPESIGKLAQLKLLDLQMSNLQSLPDSIGNLSSLVNLIIENTRITELKESVGVLKNLQFLFANNTKISRLPQSFKELTSLEKLDLDGTNISEYAEEVAHCIHNMPNLKNFRFSVCSPNCYDDDIFDRFTSYVNFEE